MNAARGATAAGVALALGLVLACSPALARGPSMAEQCARTAEEGQRSRAQGALKDAREKFQTCARKGCPRAVQADCARWNDEVTESQPTVIIRAYGRNKDELANVHVLVDDTDVVLNGLALPLDPGAHSIRLSTEEGTTEQRVVLAAGEKNRAVSLSLAPKAPPPSQQHDDSAPKSAPIPLTTYVLGGAAVVTLGTGAVFWGIGSSDHAALAASCAPSGTCSRDSVTSAKTELVVGDVLMAATVVLAAGALYYALTRGSAQSTDARFDPVVRF